MGLSAAATIKEQHKNLWQCLVLTYPNEKNKTGSYVGGNKIKYMFMLKYFLFLNLICINVWGPSTVIALVAYSSPVCTVFKEHAYMCC